MLTTPKWDNAKCAHELRELSNAAAMLEIRFGNLCRNAEPAIRLRMDKLDALDLDMRGFTLSAYAFADKLQDEADATVEAAE